MRKSRKVVYIFFIFTKSILKTKDETFNNLKKLIKNKDIVILKGDKDSSIVLVN